MDSKVVVIAGASRGIGAEVAVAFARRKAMLVLVARTPEDLERVRNRTLDAGSEEVLTVTTDISQEEEVEVLMEVALSRFGRIDLFINAAGQAFTESLQKEAAAKGIKIASIDEKADCQNAEDIVRTVMDAGM